MSEDEIELPVLPSFVSVLEHQIGGHSLKNKKSVTGVLKSEDGYLLKPQQAPPLGIRELSFYQTINDNIKSCIVHSYKPFIPKFYGSSSFEVNSEESDFIKLEDLANGCKYLCIMDVKIGRRTWDPEASAKKRKREEAKYRGTRCTVGFCIQGMKVYQPLNQKFVDLDRDYGKSLDQTNVKDAFRLFFNSQCGLKKALVQSFLNQIIPITCWFRMQSRFYFYGSSLLFVYDASEYFPKLFQEGRNCINKVSIPEKNTATVKMIDFAHVFPGDNDNIDFNYIEGIENILIILHELMAEAN